MATPTYTQKMSGSASGRYTHGAHFRVRTGYNFGLGSALGF